MMTASFWPLLSPLVRAVPEGSPPILLQEYESGPVQDGQNPIAF